MIAKDHDGDQRNDREQRQHERSFGRDRDELAPERSRTPGIVREPPLDRVREVSALSQLATQIVDGRLWHIEEYSIQPGVLSPGSSMDSGAVTPGNAVD